MMGASAAEVALNGGVRKSVRHGGAEGIRTPDLINAIDALSQLSYSPTVMGRTMRLGPFGVRFSPKLRGPISSQRRAASNSNLPKRGFKRGRNAVRSHFLPFAKREGRVPAKHARRWFPCHSEHHLSFLIPTPHVTPSILCYSRKLVLVRRSASFQPDIRRIRSDSDISGS